MLTLFPLRRETNRWRSHLQSLFVNGVSFAAAVAKSCLSVGLSPGISTLIYSQLSVSRLLLDLPHAPLVIVAIALSSTSPTPSCLDEHVARYSVQVLASSTFYNTLPQPLFIASHSDYSVPRPTPNLSVSTCRTTGFPFPFFIGYSWNFTHVSHYLSLFLSISLYEFFPGDCFCTSLFSGGVLYSTLSQYTLLPSRMGSFHPCFSGPGSFYIVFRSPVGCGCVWKSNWVLSRRCQSCSVGWFPSRTGEKNLWIFFTYNHLSIYMLSLFTSFVLCSS